MTTPPRPESAPAVELSGVTVRYYRPTERIRSFKEYAIRTIRGTLKRREFQALTGVSFRVEVGESVGIIGHNGAGKSTLFKTLARIVVPDEGRVVVRGLVAPLLELGLGFHQELTGRENVILHGALMGFSRRHMQGRLGAIAAFAELEDFLDTPMRSWSSGMWARLAFAVATDVDPDILLVDEALSVGDERFKAKCFERMAGFRARGKTFLLVSHELGSVRSACARVIWIDHGRVVRDGPSGPVLDEYRDWARRGGTVPLPAA